MSTTNKLPFRKPEILTVPDRTFGDSEALARSVVDYLLTHWAFKCHPEIVRLCNEILAVLDPEHTSISAVGMLSGCFAIPKGIDDVYEATKKVSDVSSSFSSLRFFDTTRRPLSEDQETLATRLYKPMRELEIFFLSNGVSSIYKGVSSTYTPLKKA
jgi:hypothetical protein